MTKLNLLLLLTFSSLTACGEKEEEDDTSATGDDTADTNTGDDTGVLCGSTQGFVYGVVRSEQTGDVVAWATLTAISSSDAKMYTASDEGAFELHLEGDQTWDIQAEDGDGNISQTISLAVEACVEYEQDFMIFDKVTADKPNLYLYPDADTPTTVALELRGGATLEAVAPALPWRGVAHPDGTFTDRQGETWGYLFYEVGLPRWQVRLAQHDAGWCLAGETVLDDLAEILLDYGFNAREVDDFVEAWRHDLPPAPRYGVYPQPEIAEQNGGWIEPGLPLSRLWLQIEPGDDCLPRLTPEIVPLDREGPHAVEWGVILRGFVL